MSLFGGIFGGDPVSDHLKEFKAICEEEGIPIRVTEVRRTQERQDQLYAQGRTAPGRIVTWTRSSRHSSGRAFDVTVRGAPEYDDDPDTWEYLGEIGESLGLEWGGHYQDYGHFELPV